MIGLMRSALVLVAASAIVPSATGSSRPADSAHHDSLLRSIDDGVAKIEDSFAELPFALESLPTLIEKGKAYSSEQRRNSLIIHKNAALLLLL